jgi:hypothetical protein
VLDLYATDGDQLLGVRLQPSNQDAVSGSLDEVKAAGGPDPPASSHGSVIAIMNEESVCALRVLSDSPDMSSCGGLSNSSCRLGALLCSHRWTGNTSAGSTNNRTFDE